KKVAVARLSIFSNSFLIALKFVAGFISGSVSIISEAIHSIMDLIAAVIAFFAVKFSSVPADKKHPYGHGKFENVSGVIEALLIIVAAIWIIVEAIQRFINPQKPDFLLIGAGAMFVSVIVNVFVSKRLYKVARETDSIALEADALHLKTDVYTTLGVGLGLILIWATDFYILDPIIAILVAILILFESFQLLKRAFNPLLDTSLDEEDLNTIIKYLDENEFKYHKLKTRKSGHYRFVEFHLELSGDMNLDEAHKKRKELVDSLKLKLENLSVTIQLEPLDKKCDEV
ncbi:MAG: cation transporter, partial [Bacteroidales bacterium]|nr:cation transporter [Bacteroidales bacterium]